MAKTIRPAKVWGVETRDEEMVKRVKRFLIFTIEHWELVSSTHVGNDLYIKTDHPVQHIYFNGKEIIQPND